MAKKDYKIPKFENDAQAAAFWDKHDSIPYIPQTKPARLQFPKPKHRIVIGLGERQWLALRNLARRRKLSSAGLLERLVSQELTAIR